MTVEKHDRGKPELDMIPSGAMLEIAQGFMYGAEKYDKHNWREGTEWSRYYNAAQRHMLAYNDGEDMDPESGLPHLAHAAVCIIFLLEYQRTGIGTDDRYHGDEGGGAPRS